VNILKWKTKEPLPVFMLTFERTENIQKIYEITAIGGMKVEVTPYRKTKLLPQCKNCQSWGHTKAYCHKDPRCVKCAGQHNTDNCTKPRETPPKCYNCGENHPANYRGCIVAKELQALRNKASNKMKLPPQRGKTVAITRNEQMPTQPAVGEARSYADVVKAHRSPPQGQPTADASKKDAVSARHNTDTTINQQLQLILAKLDKQERTHAALISRLDKLKNSHLSEKKLTGYYVWYSTNNDMELHINTDITTGTKINILYKIFHVNTFYINIRYCKRWQIME
jgi:hypothetical protein